MFVYLQVILEPPRRYELLVKKWAQSATSSLKCASTQASSLQVLWQTTHTHTLTHTVKSFAGTQYMTDFLCFVFRSLLPSQWEWAKQAAGEVTERSCSFHRHTSDTSLCKWIHCLHTKTGTSTSNMTPAHYMRVFLCAVGLLPTEQRGTDGWSFSETGAAPERHQPTVSWPCG